MPLKWMKMETTIEVTTWGKISWYRDRNAYFYRLKD